jgi:hypothetical protein
MRKDTEPLRFESAGNQSIAYDKPVIFPINGVLANILKPKEKVKLIFIITQGGDNKGKENVAKFNDELEMINKSIGAEITHESIELPFEPTANTFKTLTKDLIEKIDLGAEIITDITYGIKPFPFVLLCAVNFVEMYKKATLLYSVYGKVDFINKKPVNPVIYDITSLYYLQKLIGAMEGHPMESAIKMLDSFFNLPEE